MTTVEFLKSKSEVSEKIIEFVRFAERASGEVVKTLRTDNGTEHVNRKVALFLAQKGIRHETTAPYTS